MFDRRLMWLIGIALVLSAGHHVDHILRGNHVGWPVGPDLNAFSASLLIYPLIMSGIALWLSGRMSSGGWALLSGGGAIFLVAIHFGPWAIEPPGDIIGAYDSPVLGWLAFGWLLALLSVLVVSTVYELRVWRQERNGRTDPGPQRDPKHSS